MYTGYACHKIRMTTIYLYVYIRMKHRQRRIVLKRWYCPVSALDAIGDESWLQGFFYRWGNGMTSRSGGDGDGLYQTVFAGVPCQSCCGTDVQFFHDVLPVRFDRAVADKQFAGYLPTGKTSHNAAEHFDLPVR